MFGRTNRRAFIAGLGGAAAWSVVARAQHAERIRRIGVLMVYPESDSEGQARIAAFRDALENLGWKDGRNVLIYYRWVDGVQNSERVCAGAAELVAMKPDVIAAGGSAIKFVA